MWKIVSNGSKSDVSKNLIYCVSSEHDCILVFSRVEKDCSRGNEDDVSSFYESDFKSTTYVLKSHYGQRNLNKTLQLSSDKLYTSSKKKDTTSKPSTMKTKMIKPLSRSNVSACVSSCEAGKVSSNIGRKNYGVSFSSFPEVKFFTAGAPKVINGAQVGAESGFLLVVSTNCRTSKSTEIMCHYLKESHADILPSIVINFNTFLLLNAFIISLMVPNFILEYKLRDYFYEYGFLFFVTLIIKDILMDASF